MILYNEDILDILDQVFDIKHGLKPVCNKYNAYNYNPYWAVEEIKRDMKESNHAN
jgi:hypothetical protein